VPQDTLHQTCIFASDAICGSHSLFCAFRARSVNTLFFVLMWAPCKSHKNCILLHLGHEMSMRYISYSGGYGANPIKIE
jgi:hypothetical protein